MEQTEQKHTPAPKDLLIRLAKADTDATSAEHAANMLVRFSEEARMAIRMAAKSDPISLAQLRREHGDSHILKCVNSHAQLVAALSDAQKNLDAAAEYLGTRNLGEPARVLFGKLTNANARAIAALTAATKEDNK